MSWYQHGKEPLLNIGPSRCPMCFFIIFACFILAFLTFSIQEFCEDIYGKVILLLLVAYNLSLFLRTMLENPGIEPSIFEFYEFVENGGSFE